MARGDPRRPRYDPVVGHPTRAPHRLQRVAATQRWEDVAMLHWRVPAEAVAALLPPGLVPEEFDGSAWASLVPFRMVELTLPPLRPTPLTGTFPETNVRTYATGPMGPAVWFCSLDVPRAFMVPSARTLFGVPYTWSRMRIARRGSSIRYLAHRRWPAPTPLRSLVGIEIGGPVEPDDLDRFLVNRWGAYSVIRGALHHSPVVHDPWPLRHAEVEVLRDDLAGAAGLPISTVERVRFSPLASAVRFDWPIRLLPGSDDQPRRK